MGWGTNGWGWGTNGWGWGWGGVGKSGQAARGAPSTYNKISPESLGTPFLRGRVLGWSLFLHFKFLNRGAGEVGGKHFV